jgi:hypothetical protein
VRLGSPSTRSAHVVLRECARIPAPGTTAEAIPSAWSLVSAHWASRHPSATSRSCPHCTLCDVAGAFTVCVSRSPVFSAPGCSCKRSARLRIFLLPCADRSSRSRCRGSSGSRTDCARDAALGAVAGPPVLADPPTPMNVGSRASFTSTFRIQVSSSRAGLVVHPLNFANPISLAGSGRDLGAVTSPSVHIARTRVEPNSQRWPSQPLKYWLTK